MGEKIFSPIGMPAVTMMCSVSDWSGVPAHHTFIDNYYVLLEFITIIFNNCQFIDFHQ